MLQKLFYLSLCLTLSLTITSCNNQNSNGNKEELSEQEISDSLYFFGQVKPLYDNLLNVDTTAVFRGLNFGQKAPQIRAKENGRSEFIHQAVDHIQYEISMGQDTIEGNDFVEIKYFLDNKNELDIITANYYINDSTKIENFGNYLQTQFENKYGHFYVDSDGYTVWEVPFVDADSMEGKYDIAIKKLFKQNDSGLTIEYAKF